MGHTFLFIHISSQCCGSVCFWASRIWLRYYSVRIRILPSTIKKSKKKPWFLLFCDFLLTFVYENWCKCAFKSTKEKNLEIKLFFVGILSATDEKSRIRIRKSVVRIRGPGFGSVPKCHGSTTLLVKRVWSELFHLRPGWDCSPLHETGKRRQGCGKAEALL